jgi:hypothetical protein
MKERPAHTASLENEKMTSDALHSADVAPQETFASRRPGLAKPFGVYPELQVLLCQC